MPLALVTGATGFVGSHLCRELIDNGYEVRILRRPESSLVNLEATLGGDTGSVQHCFGDLSDVAALERSMDGADVVFHIAALYRQAKFPDEEYWKVNFDGTKNAVQAARKMGVRRFVHCSTIGVHSHIEHPPATESEPYAPTDVYQESKTEAEKYVLDCCRRGEIDGCVIRPAMIWGPGDTRFFKLFRGIAKRIFPVIGSGRFLCHWILVDDLVRAFRLAAESPKSTGQVYIIAGERPVTLEYTMATIARVYGVSLLPLRIPVLPFQLVGRIVEGICRPLGVEPPIHRRRADFFIKNRAFDCTKAKTDLGFAASQPFEKEAELVARSYLDRGWITLATGR